MYGYGLEWDHGIVSYEMNIYGNELSLEGWKWMHGMDVWYCN